MQDVAEVRNAARWVRENGHLFQGAVNIPFVADIDCYRIQQWVERAQRDDVSYEQLRDATLLDFEAEADLLTFMQLTCSLDIRANVCLRGRQYIENSAY